MSSRDYIRHLVANTTPGTTNLGDEVFDPVSNRLYKTIAVDGTGVSSIEVPVYVPNRPIKFPQSANNYLQFEGSNTGNPVIISSQGVDSNVSILLAPKGTGSIDIQSSNGIFFGSSSNTSVTFLMRLSTGLFTTTPTVTISPPTTVGGVQATALAYASIQTVTVFSGGTGYTNGDVLTLVGGTSYPVGTPPATVTVSSVSSGVITGITILNAGNYSVLPITPVSVTGGTGTGATINMVNAYIGGYAMTNLGSGYIETPTVTVGGTGSSASAIVGSTPQKFNSLSSAMSFLTPAGENFRISDPFVANQYGGFGPTTSFVEVYGSSSGYQGPTIRTNGNTSNIPFNIGSRGSGNIQFFTRTNLANYGTTGTQQFVIADTSSAVNYVQVTGAATGGASVISAQGSDANVNLAIGTKGSSQLYLQSGPSGGSIRFNSNSAEQGTAGGPPLAVNKFTLTGALTGYSPRLQSTGSDTNIGFEYSTFGTGSHNFYTFDRNGGSSNLQFSITHSNNVINYTQITGSATGNTLVMSAQGTDANIAMTFLPKGNGAFNISTANGVNISSGNTSITNITRTSITGTYTSIPTVIISPPTTAGGVTATATVSGLIQSGASPTINAGGTGYTVSDVLTVVGGTPVSAAGTLTVTAVSGGVITGVNYTNYSTYSALPTNAYTVTGGTGTGAQFSSTWYPSSYNITNIGSGYVEQPTISYSGGGGTGAAAFATVGPGTIVKSLGSTMSFYTPNGESFRVTDQGVTSANYVSVRANSTGNAPIFLAQGSDPNVGLSSFTKGTSSLVFGTNSGTIQAIVSHTASAVNYVQVTGAATGAGPVISAQGSDANLSLQYRTKSNFNHVFQNGNAQANFVVNQTAGTSIANYLQVASALTSNAPILSSQGSDTNIDLNIVTKNTGSINLQTGASTATQFKVIDTVSSVNYATITGSVTTGSPLFQPQGSDTNVGMELRTKNAGTLTFTKFRDATTPNSYLFQYTGGLNSDGSGGAYWRGLHIGAPNYTVSAANKFPRTSQFFELQSLTDPTYVNSYYALSNSNGANIEQYFANDTGGGYTFKSTAANSSDKSFRIAPYSTHVNYLQVAGANTANAAILSSQGSDTNVSLAIQTKGTGAIDLASGSSGVNISNGGTVTALTRTANGSAYTGFPSIAISAPTTVGGVQATATPQLVAANGTVVSGGTGYTLNDVLTVTTSGGSSAITLTVTGVSGGVVTTATANSSALTTIPSGTVSVSGGTGSGATFNLLYVIAATFTITAAGSGYVEQPTVTFSGGGGSGATAYATVGSGTIIRSLGATGTQSLDFYTPQGITASVPTMRLRDIASDSYPMVNNTTGLAAFVAQGTASSILGLAANGSGSVRLYTNGTSLTEQMRVSHTASAVNYVQVTGAATGGNPTISAQGSDGNVNLQLNAKGSGGVYTQFYHTIGSGYANRIVITGTPTTVAPNISASGSDTDIDLTLTPKGIGRVTTSATLVAGLISGGTF